MPVLRSQHSQRVRRTRQTKFRKRTTPETIPSNAVDSRMGEIVRAITEDRTIAIKPDKAATNAHMQVVWPLWNALSQDLPEYERTRILKGVGCMRMPPANKHNLRYVKQPNERDTKRKNELRRLRKLFPKQKLPLCKYTYNMALEAAAEWHKLKSYITASDRSEWRDRIEAALRYEKFDDEAFSGRVALYRVAKELRYLRPGFLQNPEPSLDDIKHLHDRFAAYERARLDGVELQSSVIFQRSQSNTDLPFEKQSFGMPNPPPRLARHLYFARLISLGKCSDEKLNEFMTHDFPKLSRREQSQFCKESKNPKIRLYSYLFLWAWLAENAPVFNIFRARWRHIHELVCERFTQDAPKGCCYHPADVDNLKVQWMEFESAQWPGQARRITPPNGAPRKGERCNISAELLTPLPRFSIV